MAINEINPDLPVNKPEQSRTPLYILYSTVIVLLVVIGAIVYKYVLPTFTPAPAVATTNKNTVTLPSNAVRVSGCIANEGEHWVQPDKIPYGPFYVTYNGKVVAYEYMFTDEDIPGKELAHMTPGEAETYLRENQMTVSGMIDMLSRPFTLPDATFKDWTLHWTPPHAAFVKPHYDIHFYLVDKAERDQICPDGTFEDILPLDLMEQLKGQGIAVPEGGKF